MPGPFSFKFVVLTRIVIILYLVCFGCYVLFTRQPDYFDGEIVNAVVVERNDSLLAKFSNGTQQFHADIDYRFLYEKGQQVKVIYETADPSNASVYALLGYWLHIGELAVSLIIIAVMYWIAVTVTSNPTPEALLEQLEAQKQKPKKPKYDP